ncbi:hypothetical protein M9H77_17619 [Catharanthus roseus]|uniref:Uncharacterized protein n=1 Tax=Catharanthus roseus TaxID=4058 RepID=A0ACC0B556_CATRO|nr:hypothetical protein M9H77_17619 [Catharanthus roseus]
MRDETARVLLTSAIVSDICECNVYNLAKSDVRDAFAHDDLYRKFHTHRDDHKRSWQFCIKNHLMIYRRANNTFLEFQKEFCTLKA